MAHLPRYRRDVRIVLSATGLLSFIPASRAAALALPELAFAAFFVGGVLRQTAGAAGPWLVLFATLLGLAVRRFDLESWALFVPGGVSGRVQQAFGRRAAAGATGVVLAERLLLTAIACVVFGNYVASLLFAVTGSIRLLRHATVADLSTFMGFAMLLWLWVRARRGRFLTSAKRARHVWIAMGVLAALAIWALGACLTRGTWPVFDLQPAAGAAPATGLGWVALAALAAFGRSAPAIGVADSIPRAAHELEPPRIAGLRRAVAITSAVSVLLTGGLALLFAALVPASADAAWS
ncbi:MAG: hypothetical protein ACRD1V_14250, partial [Vicinamibacterales bacterium]